MSEDKSVETSNLVKKAEISFINVEKRAAL